MRHLCFILTTLAMGHLSALACAQSTGPDTTRAQLISSAVTLCGVSTAAPIVSTTAPNAPPDARTRRFVALWLKRHHVALMADVALGAGPHLAALTTLAGLTPSQRTRIARERTALLRLLAADPAQALDVFFP